MSVQGNLSKQAITRGLMIAVAGVAVQFAGRNAAALTYYSFNGSTYSQDFNSLPTNTNLSDVAPANPAVINGLNYTLPAAGTPFDLSTSLSPSPITALDGWYGVAAASNKYGANGGSTTTGAIYSFGVSGSSNQALGLVSASGSGIDEIGLLLYNNTSTTYNQLNINFNSELWHQGTAAKTLDFGYAVQSTPTALPTSGLTAVNALNAGGFTTGTVQTADLTSPVATTAVSDSALNLNSNWAPGTYLWLTWTINSSAGSGQGIGINDLNVSAASVFPPANVTWAVNSGNWNTTDGNWTGGSPTPNLYKDGDNAIFGTITADSLVTVDGGGVAPGSTTISNNTNTYTFQGGAIGGNGSLTMSGTATAVLKSTNTYLGGTYLNSGTLVVDGGDDRLGAPGETITFAGGTLQTNTVGITSMRPIVVNAGGGTFNTNGLSSSTSGSLAVGDSFYIVGGGNLTLTGTVTITGAGSINIGNPTATTLDATTLTLAQASGTIDFSTNGGTINGNIIVTGATRLDFSQGVFGTTVTSGPKPEIQIQSSDAYLNATSMNATELTSGPWISNLSGDVGGTIGINIHLNSNSAAFTRSDVTPQPYPIGAGFNFPTTNAFIATIGGTKGPSIGGSTTHTGNLVINGVIYGNADLNISNSPTSGGGSGDVTLNAQNQYTGITMDNSNNSTLYIGVDNALPVGTDLIFGTLTGFGAPTVDLNGHNQTINSLSWGGIGSANAVTITNTGTANSVLTVGSPTSTTTPGADFGGLLADGVDRTDGITPRTLALVKDGSGTLVLSGVFTTAVANTYSGGTTIKGGVLQIPNDAALGSSAGALTFDGGALSFADSFDSNTNITTSSDRPLNVTSNGGTINTVCTDSVGNVNTVNVTFSGAGGYNWASTAANPLNIVGSAGSVTINGGAGTVVVTPGATIAIGAGATLNTGGTSDPFTDSSDNTKHVAIVNNGNFNVTAGAEAIASLSGSGNTTLSPAATLLVTSNSLPPTGSGTVTLNGGTLGGYGTISANVLAGSAAHTIAPSATLSPISTGTLTVATLTTNSNTTLAFNLVTPNTPGGSDTIAVAGANGLILNGGAIQVANSSTGPASLGYYKILQYSGTIGGAGLGSLTLPTGANGIVYSFDTTHDPGFIDLHRGFAGDADDNGTVNIFDFNALANHWQQTGQSWTDGDFDGNGTVNIFDFNILANNWQQVFGDFGGNSGFDLSGFESMLGISGVPEPATLSLLALFAPALLRRRKRIHPGK